MERISDKYFSTGIVNLTENLIGIRTNKDNYEDISILEVGHFLSFDNLQNLYVEISHSKHLKFVFKITREKIYYYMQAGVLKYYKEKELVNLLPQNEFVFKGNPNYDLLSSLASKYKEIIQNQTTTTHNKLLAEEETDEIKITNGSNYPIKVSIKTNNRAGDESFQLLSEKISKYWLRKKAKEIVACFEYPNKNTPQEEFLLECPGEYEFKSRSVLKNTKNINKNTPYKTKVLIGNSFESPVFIKICTNGTGNEDEFEMYPTQSDSWIRFSGELKMQIRESKGKSPSTFKFSITCPGKYFYQGNGILTNGENGEELILHDENIEITTQTKFSINIKNNSNAAVFVRITSRGEGSQDLFQLERLQVDAWKREKGNYFMEIVELDEKNYKFKVECEGSYTYEGNGLLMDNNSQEPCFADDGIVIESPSRCDIRLKSEEDHTQDYSNKYLINQTKNSNVEDRLLTRNNNCDNKDHDQTYQAIKDLTRETRNLTQIYHQNINETEIYPTESMEALNLNKPIMCRFYDCLKPKFTENNCFVDTCFPPELRVINSLNEDGNPSPFHFYEANAKPYIETNSICFNRISSIYRNPELDLFQEINPTVPVQGRLGDCYLISVLSCLAKKPDIIKKIFKTKSINPYGYYEIYFYEDLEIKVMFLDDYFPSTKNQEEPSFCRSADKKQFWCLLLEKALAKYENGYSNIHCGNSKCAFQFFTGANTLWITNLDYENTWNDIIYAARNNHLMVSGTHGTDDSMQNKYGLHASHMYSVLDAKEFYLEFGNGNVKDFKNKRLLRLLKIRNPWGRADVKTEFSLNSKIWSSEMKDYFGYSEASNDNGIFFIEYDVYMECFKDLTICYI